MKQLNNETISLSIAYNLQKWYFRMLEKDYFDDRCNFSLDSRLHGNDKGTLLYEVRPHLGRTLISFD